MIYRCLPITSLTNWLALFSNLIDIQKRKNKCNCRHRIKNLQRLVGKGVRFCSQTADSVISDSSLSAPSVTSRPFLATTAPNLWELLPVTLIDSFLLFITIVWRYVDATKETVLYILKVSFLVNIPVRIKQFQDY